MAPSFTFILFAAFLLLSPAVAQTSFRPKALVLQVKKDPKTLQYVTHLTQGTPLVPVSLSLDLGGEYMWVNCEKGYVSSTYRFVPSQSSKCPLIYSHSGGIGGMCYGASPRIGCHNNTCILLPENRITGVRFTGELGSDILTIQSTDGRNPGRVVSVPHFLFTCGEQLMNRDLADGAKGVAGLGRTKISMPFQFSAAFSFPRKFAVCLSSGTHDGNGGVIFFGNGPYIFLPGINAADSLIYTPLILNPVNNVDLLSASKYSSDYFIGVKSITINHKNVAVNRTLLSITKDGFGGTKISSINPYTVLHTSIYEAVTEFFTKELAGTPMAKAVSPFQFCYPAKNFASTRVGPAVPQIDLVLQNKKVFWSIFGANSMVQVRDDTLCLGILDGGVEAKTAIVLGGHTIENNLLQFDLASSRLGFSNSLLLRRTTCANFNFTSHA